MAHPLRDRYCIVGVGETEYSQHSGRTTRAMAVEAVKKAMEDAGLTPKDVDGLLSYHMGDSTPSTAVASDLGIRPNFFMDVSGGGSSTEALIGLAMGAIHVGMCHTVAIYRSMNGYTQVRIGGTGARASTPVGGSELLVRPYGLMSPIQRFAFAFTRHMMEYGTTNEQLAMVKVVHSRHASANPKAFKKEPITVEDVLNSRWIVKPVAHLLDCCLETDNATCIIVTSAERARHLRQRPIYIMAVQGRGSRTFPDNPWAEAPITLIGGNYIAPRIFEMAGVGPDDIDITGCYDAFTFTVVLQFEAYGFCKVGEGGHYVSSGIIALGGKRPNNTSGGHLCEGYTHGMNMVIENVRQLRGQADDYCPGWREGKHTYQYGPGGCRQAKDVEIAMNMGWGTPGYGSALILRR